MTTSGIGAKIAHVLAGTVWLAFSFFPVFAGDKNHQPGHPADQYGPELVRIADLGFGPCMDAALEDSRLFVIGGGALHVFDVSDPAKPRPLGRLSGLGKVRQIAVADGVACVTAREDGMFVVDVSRPEKPKLACHYDSIELATGVAISGKLAFIACRQAGVELVDITDPRAPVHLSTVHTGEAQSIDARDGFLYTGVWGSQELVVCDIHNPCEPVITARLPLDGFGDGVDVRGRYCFVATGHHSRATPRKQEGDPGYGHGHGLECFDLADPARPAFVSRIKTPAFYSMGMDMWSVTVSAERAILADTHNGMFVVDLSDPGQLRFLGHWQLPWDEKHGEFTPVGGFAVGDGVLYVAGAWTDLHVLSAPGMATPPEPEKDHAPVIGPAPAPKQDPRYRVYKPNGQVHGVAMAGDTALVAAGMAGVHAVRFFPEISKISEYPTRGFALDVAVSGDLAFVSEGRGGLSIWRWNAAGELSPVGRYEALGQTAKQVEVPPPGRHALLQVDNHLHILDVTDPAAPELALKDAHLGLLYYHPISQGILEERYVSCFWHVTGFYWYDLGAMDGPRLTGEQYPFRTGSRNGMAIFGDRCLATWRGGYLLLDRRSTAPPDELPKYRIGGHELEGKPTVFGNRLFCADRYSGKVIAADISDPVDPRFLGTLELREHPSPVVVHDGIPLVPGGYDGLLIWDALKPK